VDIFRVYPEKEAPRDAVFVYREPTEEQKNHPKYKLAQQICQEIKLKNIYNEETKTT